MHCDILGNILNCSPLAECLDPLVSMNAHCIIVNEIIFQSLLCSVHRHIYIYSINNYNTVIYTIIIVDTRLKDGLYVTET